MLLLLSLSSAAVALDPAFSEKLTVYHVNPEIYGAAPINMDTADLAGDAFFDLRSIAQPMECAHDSRSSDCTNPEVTSNDLVITKLVLEVDSRFGQYGMVRFMAILARSLSFSLSLCFLSLSLSLPLVSPLVFWLPC